MVGGRTGAEREMDARFTIPCSDLTRGLEEDVRVDLYSRKVRRSRCTHFIALPEEIDMPIRHTSEIVNLTLATGHKSRY